MMTEYTYIGKYREYLRKKFFQDWQSYEAKLTKNLWKEIQKKWICKDKKRAIYITDKEKEVNANEYVEKKLDQLHE